ncbi:MAG: PepSY domain-containing protein [Novosphingobium sp.]
MRKYHRWLSVLFGVILLWIAVTGVMIQLAEIKADAEPRPAAAAPAGFVCPEGMTCRPKRVEGGAKDWAEWLMHLHSGEAIGPVGTTLSVLGGLALAFFSFSGLWMYIQMWRNRSSKNLKPGWFWK